MLHAIGIDVGGTTIKSALVSADHQIIHSYTTSTPQDEETFLNYIEQHVAIMDKHASTHGFAVAEVIGVAVPGIVDEPTGTVVFSANLGWENFSARAAIETKLNRPAALGHDVGSGAVAEFAVAPQHNCIVYLALGTGLAAVTKLNGTILQNAGWAGEIGQSLVLDPISGQRTRLETIVSAQGIAQRYNALQSAAGSMERVSGSLEVFTAASRHDKSAEQVIRNAVDYLAEALAHICCLLGPTHFVVGGGLSKAGSAFVDPLTDAVAQHLEVVPVPTFSLARFGSTSQTIGAAILAFDKAAAGVRQ